MGSTGVLPVAAHGVDGGDVASFAQEGVWVLEQLSPLRAVSVTSVALRIEGHLDVAALERSFSEVVRRHQVLRTVFRMSGDRLAPVLLPLPRVTVPVVDLRDIPESQREIEALRLAADRAQRPFHLERGPLVRAALFRLDAQVHILLMVAHEIACDESSFNVVLHEISRLYPAFLSGSPSHLPEPPVQYADFARQQRAMIAGSQGKNSLAYWKQQLEGTVTAIEFPAGDRSADRSFRGARQTLDLPAGLPQGLRALVQQGSPLVPYLACFNILINRYFGQEDVLVGQLVAMRDPAGTNQPVGNFTNAVGLRTNLAGDPSARELLARVGAVVDSAHLHSTVPVEKLTEVLRLERDGSGTPIFQVAFSYDTPRNLTCDFANLTVTPVDFSIPASKYALTLRVLESAATVKVVLECRVDLLDAQMATRMLGHYRTLLEAMVADPDQSISRLRILDDGERQRVLEEGSGAPLDHARVTGVHRFFEAAAVKTPDAVAVIASDDRLTYRDLNRRANRLARHLRALGVGPEVRVGICLGRSTKIVTAILAVLKAGGAYVPLDPTYPKDRLAYMVRDAELSVLILERRTAAIVSDHRAVVVDLDAELPRPRRHADRNLDGSDSAQHLAYVIYTSGSTGEPRGVMVTHANLCHYVNALRVPVDLTSRDVYLHTASFSFSSSVRQLLLPLSHGATVVVASQEQLRDPLTLLELVRERGVTIMDLVPSHWRSCTLALRDLKDSPRAALLDNRLRLILSASEPLLSDLPRIWAEEFAHPARLVNMFGQTETAGIVSSHHISATRDDLVKVVPIGRPIPNSHVYLLDQHLQPVPSGAAGEIYIGGPGVGRGYLNRPELSAERFIRDPFHGDPEARLYKTGDLGRYAADGTLEFLGRMDHQVKIRGSRVELGEIEAVLTQHAGLRQAIVVARPHGSDDTRLVAYVVPEREPPTTSELRGYLRQRLPGHMVPWAFVSLDALPLTPTGKVDRRALPAPEQQSGDIGTSYLAPRNPLEGELTRIWEELLEVRPIGVRDSFFDRGGHSLLAVRLMHRIEECVGTRLPISTLFEGSTIEHLAEALMRREGLDLSSPIIPIQPNGSRTPVFFLTGDYHGGGFYCLNLARHLGADQPFYTLRPHGLDGTEVPRTIEEMAASSLSTLRSFQPHGPYVLGGFCNGGLIAYEMARRLRDLGEQVELVIVIEALVIGHRLRAVHRFLQFLDSRLGLDPEQVIRWHYLIKHYDRRFADLWRLPVRDQARLLAKAGAGALASARFAGPRSNGTAASEGSGVQRVAVAEPSMTELGYRRAVAAYIPGRYEGRVALLRAEEAQLLRADDPTMGWCEVAANVDVQTIPGGHTSAVTRHIEVVANCMNRWLRHASNARAADRLEIPA